VRYWILFSLLLLAPALGQDYRDPAYRAAIEDARVAEPSEVCRTLTAIALDTPGLVWEGQPGRSRVLVMRWIKSSEFDDFVGRDATILEASFVTAVPEVADWFRSHHEKATVERLEQLLGLPPKNGKTRFVQLWVWPRDLLRPSPDPEVTDREAELDFRQGVDKAYVRWFSDRQATCYSGVAPYPWTRLGYTYDWGSSNHVGVSEFVVRAHARVGVRAVVSNDEFFREINSSVTSGEPAPDRLTPAMHVLSHQTPPTGGHVGVHGMIVFGRDKFSHIPMFHEPHDYQAVMDVKLSHPDLEDGVSFGDKLHTFVPEEFSLGDVLSGKQTKFQGTLFEGNFEGDGKPLLEGVEVEVRQVNESRHLDGEAQGPERLSYVLYGEPGDTYLVHPIFGHGADFDQILKVDASNSGLTAEQLDKGVPVVIQDRPNTVDSRLVPGSEPVPASLPEQRREISLAIEKELSILVGPHFTHGPEHHH
jgi:hypothetical protein